MSDLAIDFVLDRIDSDIEEQRFALRYHVMRLGRHDVTSVRCHEAIRTLRYFRATIVRTSGYRRPVAA